MIINEFRAILGWEPLSQNHLDRLRVEAQAAERTRKSYEELFI